MKPTPFFATPPKAERAFLSAYESELLVGKVGIRIETEPLTFVDPELDRALEPEIVLEQLTLPSTDPNKLQNTHYVPNASCEGSFYFLGEHNWVDLKEIRFHGATGNSIDAEYDLVIHLPKQPPNEYPLTLRVQTEIKTGTPQLAPSRIVEGLGTLVQDEENQWKGTVTYDGHLAEVAFHAEEKTFEEIANYAVAVVTQKSLARSKIDTEIAEGLGWLTDKIKRFNPSAKLQADQFVIREFYFYKRRHHPNPELIMVLRHPEDAGHWSLTFNTLSDGHLVWVPKE